MGRQQGSCENYGYVRQPLHMHSLAKNQLTIRKIMDMSLTGWIAGYWPQITVMGVDFILNISLKILKYLVGLFQF